MGRSPCCEKNGLKKGPWTAEEDQTLIDYIKKHGHGGWRTLPKNAGLKRCGKSCRLRWTNYLRPDIKRGKFTPEEEETIIQLHSLLGNKWSAIATNLPGRTDNEIKNYWNTSIKKKLLRMGIDPVTHIPRLDLLELTSILSSNLFNQSQNLNLLGFGTVLNPDLLNLASSLLSNNLQSQNQFPLIQTNPLQNSIQTGPTDCHNYVNQFVQPSLDQVSAGILNWSQSQSQANQLENQGGFFGSSFFSTPSSCSTTPMNSSSANYVNGGSTEDERDTYCSDLLLFDIPNGLNNNVSNGCL